MSIENQNQLSGTDSFRQHLISAREIVSKWPEWKKNLLQQTNKGTSSIPRTTDKDSNKQSSS